MALLSPWYRNTAFELGGGWLEWVVWGEGPCWLTLTFPLGESGVLSLTPESCECS